MAPKYRYKNIVIISMLVNILLFLNAMAEEPKNDLDKVRFYIEKGDKYNGLTINEFHALLTNLRDVMMTFKKNLGKINIYEAEFNYKSGKIWESNLEDKKRSFEQTSQLIELVKQNPNKISYSLYLHILLNTMILTGDEFSRIPQFKKRIYGSYLDLIPWMQAFEKSHLLPLAKAKDDNEKLY